MKVTVGIKALNEERHVEAAIRSALAAVAPFDGEVILADSGSTDRTIAIAGAYPVRIVQLADPSERCCGAGAQLAYQFARGDYFYLLDGDMVLDPDFLPAGIAYLEAHTRVAGVGGRVNEVNVANTEFQIRAEAAKGAAASGGGPVDRLDCGGLYRTAAIREVGYFADRNLHAFEEFELGARLIARGWALARLDQPAVDHFGHAIDGYRLMWRRIRSGYAGATGEVLRAAIGRDHLGGVLRRMSHICFGFVVLGWWAAIVATILVGAPVWLWAGLLAAPFLWLAHRRRSVRLALYSFAAWNSAAWGLVSGAVRRRVPPTEPLAAIELAADPRAA
jgi:glycosyltransferase involved in cell wall biosynthesis